MTPPEHAPHRAQSAAESTATTAAADVLATTPVHPDHATWDQATNGQLDPLSPPSTPYGVLIAAVGAIARDARYAAERAREHRAEADRLETAAAEAMHRLSIYRAAVDSLNGPAQEHP